MPLRDHFRPPVSQRSSWEGLHGGWPMTMVQHLAKVLPPDYSAEPRVHLGSFFEIDVSAYENESMRDKPAHGSSPEGGLALATWSPSQPTLAVDAELSEPDEYAVEIYDHSRGRKLVAAVEVVSPGNKDRRESRRAFVAKCESLLRQRVCVAIVDLVSIREFNLYVELLDQLGRSDAAFDASVSLYAASCRTNAAGKGARLESWAYALTMGRPLPTLPLWLADDLAIPLDLEASYEDACRALRIVP